MAKEQIIYLGPEEELTNVRERLENTKAGHIILVIPLQTQLRSHVGWRLLHSRVRELGQDVLVISSDRQIRAVAKAAGFRVADSLGSPPSDSPRAINRPVRKNMSGKTSQRVNTQASSNKVSRSLRQGQQQIPPSTSTNGSPLNSSYEMERGFDSTASSTFEIEDVPHDDPYDLPIDTMPPLPAHFETVPPPSQFGAEDQEESETDSWMQDYYVARSIREAAQGTDSEEVSSATDETEISSGHHEQFRKVPQPNKIEDDRFAYIEDIQPAALPEQRASTHIPDTDQGIPDIPDVPTAIYGPDNSHVPSDVQDGEVEDLGEDEDGMHQHDLSSQGWDDHMLEEPGGQKLARMNEMSPGYNHIDDPARPPFNDLGNEDDLLPPSNPVPDQQTRIASSNPAHSPAAPLPSTAARRDPQPIIQPSAQARNVTTTSSVHPSQKPASTKSRRVVTNPPVSTGASLGSKSNGKRNLAIVSISLGVLLLIFLAFLYFGSNATVNVVVPTQTLRVSTPYVASTSQQNSIPSEVLTYTASATGQGTATGTVKQGNQFATGTVTFTNKGKDSIDIPTGTILLTSGAVPVQFVTVADVLVLPDSGNNNIPSVAPIQAQKPGESGNVSAGSITLINLSTLAPNILTVTNPQPTTGGGASDVPAVTSSDVNTLEVTLQQQVQNEIKAWLQRVVHQGDVAGTPFPDVVTSPTPLSEENVSTTPAVGQPAASGGKFTSVLSVKVSVLVIRKAEIQKKASAQLMASAALKNPPTVLATQLPIAYTVTNVTPSKDGTTLSITVNATGQVFQQVPASLAQGISQQLTGKSVDEAKKFIKSGQAGMKGVSDSPIVIFPPFLGYMPFRAEQIHIVVTPGPTSGKPNG